MAALFAPPQMPAIPAPPPVPSLSDDRVQQAASDTQKKAPAGRASTYLTDPQTQRSAQDNAQRYLGGI